MEVLSNPACPQSTPPHSSSLVSTTTELETSLQSSTTVLPFVGTSHFLDSDIQSICSHQSPELEEMEKEVGPEADTLRTAADAYATDKAVVVDAQTETAVTDIQLTKGTTSAIGEAVCPSVDLLSQPQPSADEGKTFLKRGVTDSWTKGSGECALETTTVKLIGTCMNWKATFIFTINNAAVALCVVALLMAILWARVAPILGTVSVYTYKYVLRLYVPARGG